MKRIKEFLKDLWWSTGIPGRRLVRQIIDGTISNFEALPGHMKNMREDWERMTLAERWWELYWEMLKEELKTDCRYGHTSEHVKSWIELIMESNPTLELKGNLYWFILHKRIDALQRQKARTARKARTH